ncbi:winged helix DNA-binding domain-containing protein [Streptomyces triticisoli]|uniref:winged helix DNA-binding domain-containing protein n=1 Tax=Streptomyces triticisoli TaxID=2182797 RepID=UPI000DD9E290|nr:winged helix DNA-binding domain-containing protein [Streptomyces triticisoli]
MATTATQPAGVLDRRALNRAFLARQLLLSRRTMPAEDALEHLVGLQAQAPIPPYYGLWTRLEDFRPAELAGLLTGRRAVRIALMRGTVHLVSSADCRKLRPCVQPFLERSLITTFGKDLNGLDPAKVATAGRELLEEAPHTVGDLSASLRTAWPDRPAAALGNVVRSLLPVVQIPPRGVWGQGGQPTYVMAEDWLGAPLDPEPDIDALVLRYLAAFGPATVKDVQAWSGLTRLRAVTERLRPRLVSFRDEDGRELLDLPDAPRPDPGTPAPVRYLAPYDNAILSHADRTRIISDEHRKAIATKNAVIPGTILVDGFVAGAWRIDRTRASTALDVQLFSPVGKRRRAELVAEGERLLLFASDGAAACELRIADA